MELGFTFLYIGPNHHIHQSVPSAQFLLTLSRHPSLFINGLKKPFSRHSVFAESWWMQYFVVPTIPWRGSKDTDVYEFVLTSLSYYRNSHLLVQVWLYKFQPFKLPLDRRQLGQTFLFPFAVYSVPRPFDTCVLHNNVLCVILYVHVFCVWDHR